MAYYKSVTEMIGNTPMVEFGHYEKAHGLQAKIIAKVEGLNPAGSVKDRAALAMLMDAENLDL